MIKYINFDVIQLSLTKCKHVYVCCAPFASVCLEQMIDVQTEINIYFNFDFLFEFRSALFDEHEM